jgi:molybdate transport system substrate-binding protein
MNRRRLPVLAILGITLICQLCAGQEITVAAAADLQSAMQDVAARFERQTGTKVKVIFGSSGDFFQQIENGAPFDVFFSANLDYPKKLEAAGLIEHGSYYQYARGKIVVWVPNDSKINLNSGLKALIDPTVKKIAIANPLHAPYGQAAVSAMQKEGIFDNAKDKFVLGDLANGIIRRLGLS